MTPSPALLAGACLLLLGMYSCDALRDGLCYASRKDLCDDAHVICLKRCDGDTSCNESCDADHDTCLLDAANRCGYIVTN